MAIAEPGPDKVEVALYAQASPTVGSCIVDTSREPAAAQGPLLYLLAQPGISENYLGLVQSPGTRTPCGVTPS
jgi:hypothetical protein